MSLAGATLLTISLAAAAPQQTPAGSPFEDAAIAPADVTTYFHVRNAAEIRKQLADRPIARCLAGVFKSGECHKAWSGLAQAAQIDEGRLFDVCVGRRFTFISRCGSGWVLLTQVDPQQATRLLGQLKVRVREPKAGMAIAELPEQELLIARDGALMAIGPVQHSKLFFDILPRVTGARDNSLITHPGLLEARELGGGCIGVFRVHDPPMGGYSIAVADLDGDQVSIRHTACFDNAPFNHSITKLTCDFSPALRFERDALVAFIQPMDIGDGPVEAFITASLREGLIPPQMRAKLGERRLIVVGEQDLRQVEPPIDVLSATVVTCLELKDRQDAVEPLDQHMLNITKRLNDLGKGTFLIQAPEVHCKRHGEPREIDLSPATEWFTGGFPIMKNISLNWTVAQGPHSAWLVIGSHRRSLDDVVKVLESDGPSNRRFVGKFDSCGMGNGRRIGRHLRSWCDHAEHFAQPADVEEFRAKLRMMSELAGAIHKSSWQLARPSPDRMRLDIQIELAPSESARSE